MIYVQQFFGNYFYFLSHTHIVFLLFLSIVLVFVSIPLFLCNFMTVSKVVIKMVDQITQLYLHIFPHITFIRRLTKWKKHQHKNQDHSLKNLTTL